eukprot:3332019-Prymnesium_polylepis.1
MAGRQGRDACACACWATARGGAFRRAPRGLIVRTAARASAAADCGARSWLRPDERATKREEARRRAARSCTCGARQGGERREARARLRRARRRERGRERDMKGERASRVGAGSQLGGVRRSLARALARSLAPKRDGAQRRPRRRQGVCVRVVSREARLGLPADNVRHARRRHLAPNVLRLAAVEKDERELAASRRGRVLPEELGERVGAHRLQPARWTAEAERGRGGACEGGGLGACNVCARPEMRVRARESVRKERECARCAERARGRAPSRRASPWPVNRNERYDERSSSERRSSAEPAAAAGSGRAGGSAGRICAHTLHRGGTAESVHRLCTAGWVAFRILLRRRA